MTSQATPSTVFTPPCPSSMAMTIWMTNYGERSNRDNLTVALLQLKADAPEANKVTRIHSRIERWVVTHCMACTVLHSRTYFSFYTLHFLFNSFWHTMMYLLNRTLPGEQYKAPASASPTFKLPKYKIYLLARSNPPNKRNSLPTLSPVSSAQNPTSMILFRISLACASTTVPFNPSLPSFLPLHYFPP